MNNQYNILHLSDLHFGKDSIAYDSKYIVSFDDFFSLLKDTINKIIIKHSIDMIIISGDMISRGDEEQLQNQYLEELFKIFIASNIPILPCIGNHDLNRELIEEKKQFVDFNKFIQKNKERFQIRISSNFVNNQACFYYNKDSNMFFFTVNSCKNIEKKYINEDIKLRITSGKIKKNIDTYLDKDFLKVGILSRKDIADLFDEMAKFYGKSLFNDMNKFLVCHHTLDQIKDNKMCINFLNEKRVGLIFSGHDHGFYYKIHGKINNLGSGSLLASIESRNDSINLLTNPPEFNYYSLNIESGELLPTLWYYDKDSEWKEEEKEENIVKINLIIKYSVENWVQLHGLNEEALKELQKRGIVSIIKKEQDDDELVFIDSTNNKKSGFLITELDTQIKIDLIRKWVVMHYTQNSNLNDSLIILKNTKKFVSQLPESVLINLQ